MKTNGIRFLASAATLVALSACGGGGGSSTPVSAASTTASGGVTKDLAQGTITGFGSVYIRGQKYDTDDAEFFRDGENSGQDDFSVGMKVKIAGDFDEDRADIVSYDEDVKGPVDEAFNPATNTLVVMGQTVLVTPDTYLDDSLDLNTVMVGDLLEVSGYRGLNDVLEASYIELKRDDNTNAFKVIGQVRSLDQDAAEFSIGDLRVNYATAELDDIGQLVDGLLVEVKDANKNYTPGLLTLQATKVEGESYSRPDELVDDDDDESGDDVEYEGIISEILSDSSFALGGLVVNHDAQTTFIYGDASLLAVGTKVEAEGSLLSADTLDADKIKFSRNGARVSGIVEMVNLDTRMVTVFGVEVLVPEEADLEDDLNGNEPFMLEDLRDGDFVEIRGRLTLQGVIATSLERDETGDTELRGAATDIDPLEGTLTILGVLVRTSEFTEYEIDDDDDGMDDGFDDSAGSDEFFDMLNEGQSVVEAKWDGAVISATVPADELELED
jgi:hypothetical protein